MKKIEDMRNLDDFEDSFGSEDPSAAAVRCRLSRQTSAYMYGDPIYCNTVILS